jgi:hypothetical protein
MKKHLIFIVASLLLVTGSLHAQSVGLVADIPFDFVVGDKTLPAGQYAIHPMTANESVVMLSSSDLKTAMLIAPCDCASETTPQQQSKLIFKVSGGRYFLWQIWTEGSNVGRELSVQPRETEEASLAPPLLVAVPATIRKG